MSDTAQSATDIKPVDDDYEVAVGDHLIFEHCVQAPNIPGNEVIAALGTTLTNFQKKINNELPGCVTVEVINKNMYRSSGVVVDGDECEFIHETEVRVTDYQPGECPDNAIMTAGVIGINITTALLIIAGLVALSIVFHQARKFFTTEGGERVSTALLLAAGGFALMQLRKTGESFTGDDD